MYHRGGVSFGDVQKRGLGAQQRAIIDARYPFFRPEQHLRARPRPARRDVRRARARRSHERDATRPHVLHMLHSPPDATGGTEKYVAALLRTLEHEFDFSVLYPVESGFVLRTVVDRRRHGGRERVPAARRAAPGRRACTTRSRAPRSSSALDLFDFDAVHVHNLIGYSLAPLDALARLRRSGRVLGARPLPRVPELLAALHEERSVRHPRRPLGVRAAASKTSRCRRCPARRRCPTSPPSTSTSSARRSPARLGAVDHWVFPSQSAADYFLRVYEPDPATRGDHRARLDDPPRPPPEGARRAAPPRRAVARRVRRAGLVEEGARRGERAGGGVPRARAWRSITSAPSKQPASPELHSHGGYDNELLPELLHRAGIQVVLLPGRLRGDLRDRDERGAWPRGSR